MTYGRRLWHLYVGIDQDDGSRTLSWDFLMFHEDFEEVTWGYLLLLFCFCFFDPPSPPFPQPGDVPRGVRITQRQGTW